MTSDSAPLTSILTSLCFFMATLSFVFRRKNGVRIDPLLITSIILSVVGFSIGLVLLSGLTHSVFLICFAGGLSLSSLMVDSNYCGDPILILFYKDFYKVMDDKKQNWVDWVFRSLLAIIVALCFMLGAMLW